MTVEGLSPPARAVAGSDLRRTEVLRTDMTISIGGRDQANVAVTGEVDACNADQLRLAILGAGTAQGVEVEVDLAGVTFMDSTGLSAIADAASSLGRPGAGLVLRNVPRQVQRILDIMDPERRIAVRR